MILMVEGESESEEVPKRHGAGEGEGEGMELDLDRVPESLERRCGRYVQQGTGGVEAVGWTSKSFCECECECW